MLLCNLPEALLDKFLDAMQTDGLRIDHKAVVTAYNRDMELHELMDDISEEHERVPGAAGTGPAGRAGRRSWKKAPMVPPPTGRNSKRL